MYQIVSLCILINFEENKISTIKRKLFNNKIVVEYICLNIKFKYSWHKVYKPWTKIQLLIIIIKEFSLEKSITKNKKITVMIKNIKIKLKKIKKYFKPLL